MPYRIIKLNKFNHLASKIKKITIDFGRINHNILKYWKSRNFNLHSNGLLSKMYGFISLLPLVFVVSFYTWAMISVHGFVQGIHLASLAVSFFVIGTPLPSYLFIVGLLPGNILSKGGRNLGIFVLWIGFLILNVATFYYLPKFYSGSVITTILYRVLDTPNIRFSLLSLSGFSLLYHWLVSKLESRFIKIWLHTVGIVVSGLLFYLIIPAIREILVLHMNIGIENF